jgi:hypothetical protein
MPNLLKGNQMLVTGRRYRALCVGWSLTALSLTAGLLTVIAGCGGGGGNGGTSPATPTITSVTVSCSPSSIHTNQTSACTPTVNGTGSFNSSVTWSVSPTSIGTVSGSGVFTPASVGTATITATSTQDSTKSGSATVTVNIAAPSNLVYVQTTITATVGQAITPDTPTVTGTVSSYSVSPALPAGLSLNTTTGTISGTPTATAAQASYTVTATNTTGSTTATVQITVVPVAPSNLVYPQTVINASTGVAIQSDTPTVTGVVTAYSIAPALPAGLSIDPIAGVLAGTPTVATARTNYTVTASNAGGSTTAAVQITVAQSPPSNLVYPQTVINATVGTAIETDTPTVTGSVSGYGIVPALPAGLSFDQATGAISGTPTLPIAQTVYTVYATNAGGSTTTQLTITVAYPGTVLLDQGHQTSISQVFTTSDNVLSAGLGGHWVLWDYSSAAILAEGDGAVEGQGTQGVDLEGEIFAVGGQVRSAVDGHVLANIRAQQLTVAKDGSYVCGPTNTGLTVWSPSGQPEVVLNGDYSAAIIFAAPGQVQIAHGAAGTSVIETVTVPGGVDTVSPTFSGHFNSWFTDGGNFLTQLGDVVWVYSSAGKQQAVMSQPTNSGYVYRYDGGQGNWVWFASEPEGVGTDLLQVFAIGSAAPAQTYNLPEFSTYIPSGLTLGALAYGTPQASVIDLSGANPAISTYTLTDASAYPSAYAANSSSLWVVGTQNGVLLDGASLSGTPRYFGFGSVYDIAAAGNTAAVSTAIGQILLYEITVPQQTGSIAFSAGEIALSSDATVLGAAAETLNDQYARDRTLNIYSLPSMSVLQSFPYTFGSGSFLTDFSLSGSGTSLGLLLETTGSSVSFSRQVTGITGTPLIWSDTGVNEPIDLSPNGTLIAVSNGAASSASVTKIYQNGTLVTAVPGEAEGWIDNGHLLVGTYAEEQGDNQQFNGSTIYSPTGAVVSTLPSNTLPPMSNPQFPTASSVYDTGTNAIYSLTTGLVIWQGAGEGRLPGAVTGSTAIYEFDDKVILAPIN